MNPYAAEHFARQRTEEVRTQAARSQPAPSNHFASHRGPSVRNVTGWALIQIGLALVTSPPRQEHTAAMRPELP